MDLATYFQCSEHCSEHRQHVLVCESPSTELALLYEQLYSCKMPKSQVTVFDRYGYLHLRWTYKSKQYRLSTGLSDTKSNRKAVDAKVKMIESDIAYERVDVTLEKYGKVVKKEFKVTEEKRALTLTELLEKRLKNKFCSPDKALLHLLRYYSQDIETTENAQDFINWIKETRGTANRTIKRYLDTLQVISPTIFKPIKITVESKPLPKPFTTEETRAIIDWFQTSEYYRHYADYVKFLFLTGTRTSEAIGLRWKHIDFNRNLLFISESLGRNKNNTSHRIRKTTKTNKTREFPMNHTLLEMLTARHEQSDKNPESLVFSSPKGCSIDDHNFSQRIWRKCLGELKIEYRPQYNTRHTFISHFLEKTKDVVKCASLTHGSKSGIQTIFNNYAGIINRVEVPELF